MPNEDGIHNGNGNGRSKDRLDRFADQTANQSKGQSSIVETVSLVVAELKQLRTQQVDLIKALELFMKVHGETTAELVLMKEICREIQSILERVMLPMAEQNRDLRLKEVDEKIFVPLINRIAQLIDRISREVSQAERESPLIKFVENCRELDLQELFEVMTMLDVESISSRPGTVLDPKIHRIASSRPSRVPNKIGQVVRSLRPGYRRRGDGLLIRPELVEMWIQPSARNDA